MAMKHLRIKALKAGVQVAGISMQPGQIVEIDIDESQLAGINGDIVVDDGTGKVDLSAANVELDANPADNAPKANTPMHSGIPDVVGASPDLSQSKDQVDLKASRAAKGAHGDVKAK